MKIPIVWARLLSSNLANSFTFVVGLKVLLLLVDNCVLANNSTNSSLKSGSSTSSQITSDFLKIKLNNLINYFSI